MVEGARLEIWCVGNGTVGSNPTLSATSNFINRGDGGRSVHTQDSNQQTIRSHQGEVSEWLKVQHWKCCVVQATAGSNPALSATTYRDLTPPIG